MQTTSPPGLRRELSDTTSVPFMFILSIAWFTGVLRPVGFFLLFHHLRSGVQFSFFVVGSVYLTLAYL